MAVTSQRELRSALSVKDWEAIVGTPESEWLDFKRAPYPLQSEADKWELAKDVAAFANGRGGFIVIGFDAEKAPHTAMEIATAPRWVSKASFHGEKVYALIAQRIFPRVRGAKLHWYPKDDADAEGIFVVEVPAQDEGQKPFLVEGKVDHEGRYSNVAFGYPYREGDRVEWMRAEEIQRRINEALIGGRPMPSALQRSVTERIEPLDRAQKRIDTIVAAQRWESIARVFLQALPPPRGPEVLPGFHDMAGIRGALANPRSIREHGFNLSMRSDPEVRDGSLVNLADSRRAIWLDADGAFTAGGLAVPDFLGWGLNRDDQSDSDPLRLSSLALCEYTLEFFRFVHEALVPKTRLDGWIFRFAFRNFDKPRRVTLAPGPPSRWGRSKDSAGSPNDGDMSPKASVSAGRDAFEVVAWIYALFGFAEDQVPFAQDREIKTELIAAYR